MGNHLEDLICEFYEWQGCFVRRNVKVNLLDHGGWGGELDVVVFDPKFDKIIHYEPSTDASSWSKREERYKRKFELGRTHIPELFPGRVRSDNFLQRAVFFNVGKERREFLGGEAITIDELVKEIMDEFDRRKVGRVGASAIPEQFGLLRTMQLVRHGYVRPLWAPE